ALSGIVEGLDGLVAVCISSTRVNAERAVRRVVKAANKAAPDVPVLLGGASIQDADHASTLGADGYAKDAPGAVEVLLELVSG
ncbi:MAG: hypothetical protein HKM97_02295, partial [Acidimicrobiia bacterium]|nr:hypothetical protein [Acidimicrobiia bacterium]NNF87335.1 hypothetical protein [Acidimicrobiia bacterium]